MKNEVEINVQEYSNDEMIERVLEDILHCKSKTYIFKYYMKEYGLSKNTVKAFINEAIGRLVVRSKTSKNEMKSLNTQRLEQMLEEASIGQKLKIIQELNRMYNLYEGENQDNQTNITFKL